MVTAKISVLFVFLSKCKKKLLPPEGHWFYFFFFLNEHEKTVAWKECFLEGLGTVFFVLRPPGPDEILRARLRARCVYHLPPRPALAAGGPVCAAVQGGLHHDDSLI